MLNVVKVVLALLVLALAGQQLVMYYEIVVAGTFTSSAAFHQFVITVILWPLVVVLVAFVLLRAIVTFKPSSLE